jgi:hypothetical protein
VSDAIDPVTLRVVAGALRAACEEMGAVLVRAAHSAEHQGAAATPPAGCSTPTARW